jgi:hypothetical protein
MTDDCDRARLRVWNFATGVAVAALAVGAAHVNAADQDNVTPAASGHDATIMSDAGPPSMPMQSAVAPAGKTRADVLQELITNSRNWQRLATTRRLTTNFIPTISTWRSAGFGSNTRQTARSKARSRRRPPDDFMDASAFHTSQRRWHRSRPYRIFVPHLRCGSGRHFPDQADCLGHSASTAADVAITIASARRVVNCGLLCG